jgi:hypothetical protein
LLPLLCLFVVIPVLFCCHSVAQRRNLQLPSPLHLPVFFLLSFRSGAEESAVAVAVALAFVVVLLLSFRSEAEESAVAIVLPWHLPCHCLFFNQSRPPQKLRHPDRSCRCFCFCPAVKKGFQRALKKSLF